MQVRSESLSDFNLVPNTELSIGTETPSYNAQQTGGFFWSNSAPNAICKKAIKAAADGKHDIVDFLVMEGCIPSYAEMDENKNTLLHHIGGDYSNYDKYPGIVDKILQDANVKSFINLQNVDGNTPLHIAAIAGNTDMAKRLHEAGADLTIKNEGGFQIAAVSVDSDMQSDIKPTHTNGTESIKEMVDKYVETPKKPTSPIKETSVDTDKFLNELAAKYIKQTGGYCDCDCCDHPGMPRTTPPVDSTGATSAGPTSGLPPSASATSPTTGTGVLGGGNACDCDCDCHPVRPTMPAAVPAAVPPAGPSAGPSAGPPAGPSAGPSAGPLAGPSAGPSAEPSKGPLTGPLAELATVEELEKHLLDQVARYPTELQDQILIAVDKVTPKELEPAEFDKTFGKVSLELGIKPEYIQHLLDVERRIDEQRKIDAQGKVPKKPFTEFLREELRIPERINFTAHPFFKPGEKVVDWRRSSPTNKKLGTIQSPVGSVDPKTGLYRYKVQFDYGTVDKAFASIVPENEYDAAVNNYYRWMKGGANEPEMTEDFLSGLLVQLNGGAKTKKTKSHKSKVTGTRKLKKTQDDYDEDLDDDKHETQLGRMIQNQAKDLHKQSLDKIKKLLPKIAKKYQKLDPEKDAEEIDRIARNFKAVLWQIVLKDKSLTTNLDQSTKLLELTKSKTILDELKKIDPEEGARLREESRKRREERQQAKRKQPKPRRQPKSATETKPSEQLSETSPEVVPKESRYSQTSFSFYDHDF
jgi:hypothetical protein